MKLEDILPFVAPFARSLAEPTIYHHAKLAAVEFCSRTLVLQEELDPIVADGTRTEFDLTPVGHLEVCKLLRVWVDDDEYDHTNGLRGRRAIRANTYDELTYADGRTCVRVNPAPREGQEVTSFVAVRPILTQMPDLDDRLRPHLQDLAHGALAGLLALKGPERDMDAAAANRAMFNNRIATVGLQVSRGFGAGRITAPAQFF